MKLSDVMSAMVLSTYAEIALVIFLAVFIGVVLQLLSHRNKAIYERLRHLPLDDDSTDPQTPTTKPPSRK